MKASQVAHPLGPAPSPYAIPGLLWTFFAVGALLGLLTPNPLLTAASILVLPVFMALLWRQGETPVLLFAVAFQWLQVSAKVFHANVLGVDVTELSSYSLVGLPSIERAIWFGLFGLVVLAVGMRVGMWKLGAVDKGRADEEARRFSINRAFILYLVCTAVATLLETLLWQVGGLIQVLRAVLDIKWIGFFVLGYLVLKRRERYLFFAVAVLIEFINGIGFFSGFKTVIFFTIIVIFTVHYRLKPKVVVSGVGVLILLLILGVGWTSIKGEYRAFLNQGTGMQTTVVSRSDQFDKLGELIGDLEWYDMVEGLGGFFERLAYVDYFALTMEYVPDYVPHEDGELWKRAVVHVFTPRAFYPDKPPLIPDSDVTMQYTGLSLASAAEGTSISIGYMGESYVDLGPYGMFVPIFLLGVLWGFMYYYFVSRARFVVIGFAFATAALINAHLFEITAIKLLGGVTMVFLVLASIMYFTEKHIGNWLQKGAQRERAPAKTLAYEGG